MRILWSIFLCSLALQVCFTIRNERYDMQDTGNEGCFRIIVAIITVITGMILLVLTISTQIRE